MTRQPHASRSAAYLGVGVLTIALLTSLVPTTVAVHGAGDVADDLQEAASGQFATSIDGAFLAATTVGDGFDASFIVPAQAVAFDLPGAVGLGSLFSLLPASAEVPDLSLLHDTHLDGVHVALQSQVDPTISGIDSLGPITDVSFISAVPDDVIDAQPGLETIGAIHAADATGCWSGLQNAPRDGPAAISDCAAGHAWLVEAARGGILLWDGPAPGFDAWSANTTFSVTDADAAWRLRGDHAYAATDAATLVAWGNDLQTVRGDLVAQDRLAIFTLPGIAANDVVSPPIDTANLWGSDHLAVADGVGVGTFTSKAAGSPVEASFAGAPDGVQAAWSTVPAESIAADASTVAGSTATEKLEDVGFSGASAPTHALTEHASDVAARHVPTTGEFAFARDGLFRTAPGLEGHVRKVIENEASAIHTIMGTIGIEGPHEVVATSDAAASGIEAGSHLQTTQVPWDVTDAVPGPVTGGVPSAVPTPVGFDLPLPNGDPVAYGTGMAALAVGRAATIIHDPAGSLSFIPGSDALDVAHSIDIDAPAADAAVLDVAPGDVVAQWQTGISAASSAMHIVDGASPAALIDASPVDPFVITPGHALSIVPAGDVGFLLHDAHVPGAPVWFATGAVAQVPGGGALVADGPAALFGVDALGNVPGFDVTEWASVPDAGVIVEATSSAPDVDALIAGAWASGLIDVVGIAANGATVVQHLSGVSTVDDVATHTAVVPLGAVPAPVGSVIFAVVHTGYAAVAGGALPSDVAGALDVSLDGVPVPTRHDPFALVDAARAGSIPAPVAVPVPAADHVAVLALIPADAAGLLSIADGAAIQAASGAAADAPGPGLVVVLMTALAGLGALGLSRRRA